MNNVLICWMGVSDKNAFSLNDPKKSEGKDLGPVGAAIDWAPFDHAYILWNQAFDDIFESYGVWLESLFPRVKIHMIKADISDPTDYSEIYKIAIDTARRIDDTMPSAKFTFHTSSGTPQMGFIWLLLQKRFNARLIKSGRGHGISIITFPFYDLLAELIEKGASIASSETGTLIYDSALMSRLIDQIEKVGPLSRPVLLEGESGTGKELFAKHLHEHRLHTRTGPFIAVNCGAISKDLVESELFGHVKGAFTGAAHDKTGKIEQADNGTLFLDEIGEMPLDLQVKLLRVLQEKEVTPVGDGTGKPRKVNFRLVAATNRQLIDEVAEGNFREDLYYRIAVINFKIPPLRKRGKGDISKISEHYINGINEEFSTIPGYRQKRLTDDALERLHGYHWPGNVRELSNVLYRAAILQPDTPLISEQDIEESLGDKGNIQQDTLPILGRLEYQSEVNLDEIVDDVRRHYLTAALKKCHGNKSKMSRMLGYKNNPHHFLKKYDIGLSE